MAKQSDGSDWKTAARGESQWKEEMAALATRNAEVRKAGKQEREAYETERERVRRIAPAKSHAKLVGRGKP